MLLASDGSTTPLLESLLGERLGLDLIDQHTVRTAKLEPRARAVLGCRFPDEAVERRSALLLPDASRVSLNYVAFVTEDPDIVRVLSDNKIPIGRGLRTSGMILGRRVLASGLSSWAPAEERDGQRLPCAFKEYVLVDAAQNAVAYVHESFNPAYIPTGGS